MSDYLLNRVQVPWMHDLMVSCQEISAADVELFHARSLPDEHPDEHPAVVDRPSEVAPAPKPAVADQPLQTDDGGEMLKALAWATKLKDHAIIVGLAESLPHAVLEEQLRAYRASTAIAEAPKPEAASPRILVYPHLLKSRMQVAAAFNAYLLRQKWVIGTRLPYKACSDFIAERLIWSKGVLKNAKMGRQSLRR